MRLKDYIKKHGPGTLTTLHFDTKLAYSTLNKAKLGQCAFACVGELIEKATNGEVKAHEVLKKTVKR